MKKDKVEKKKRVQNYHFPKQGIISAACKAGQHTACYRLDCSCPCNHGIQKRPYKGDK